LANVEVLLAKIAVGDKTADAFSVHLLDVTTFEHRFNDKIIPRKRA